MAEHIVLRFFVEEPLSQAQALSPLPLCLFYDGAPFQPASPATKIRPTKSLLNDLSIHDRGIEEEFDSNG